MYGPTDNVDDGKMKEKKNLERDGGVAKRIPHAYEGSVLAKDDQIRAILVKG